MANGYLFDNAGLGKAANHPPSRQSLWQYRCEVVQCAERDGRPHARLLARARRRTTVYRAGSCMCRMTKWNAGYRLPTEAEWKRRGVGWVEGKRFPGDTDAQPGELPQHACVSLRHQSDVGYHPTGNMPYTSPVGRLSPTSMGCKDMAGNVAGLVLGLVFEHILHHFTRRPIRVVRRHRTALFEAAVGTTSRSTAGRRRPIVRTGGTVALGFRLLRAAGGRNEGAGQGRICPE